MIIMKKKTEMERNKIRRLNLFAALTLICATQMLTSCREEYSDALVVMGYEIISNAGTCSDMWYVLPDGRIVHKQNLEGDKYTSSTNYVVNKDSLTIRVYNYEQHEGSQESQAGYQLKFNLEKQTVSFRYIDCNGDIDEEAVFQGITGPGVKHVDWDGIKALFQK